MAKSEIKTGIQEKNKNFRLPGQAYLPPACPSCWQAGSTLCPSNDATGNQYLKGGIDL